MPRPEHCPWNLYCVIKECWSYQVILELYFCIGVVRWFLELPGDCLCVCLTVQHIQNTSIFKKNIFSQRQGRPGKPLWRRLEASTTRWQFLENIITNLINHHCHHQGETWDLLGAALRSKPPHPHLFPRELRRSLKKTGERNAHDEGLFNKKGK